MKKDWKGSTGAKIGAWIGITLCGCMFLGSVVGIIGLEEGNVYDYSEEEFRRQAYESVASHYAIRALDNIEHPGDGKWQDTYFRYGIIKADNIDDVDFNDDSVYLERNFNDLVEPEELYIQNYEIGPDTEFDYSGTLFGGYSIYDRASSYVMSVPIQQIVYNKENGIFYYDTSGDFYPVQTVEFMSPTDGEWYTFNYDFDRMMYRNVVYTAEDTAESGDLETSVEMAEGSDTASAETLSGGSSAAVSGKASDDGRNVTAGEGASEQRGLSLHLGASDQAMVSVPTQPVEVAEASGNLADKDDAINAVDMETQEQKTYETAEEVLAESYITFDMFDGTEYNYENWGMLNLDGVERNVADETELNGLAAPQDEVWLIGNGYLVGKAITSDREYTLLENGFLEVNGTDAGKNRDTYWVVTIIPESVGLGWNQDLYVQANMIVSLAYDFRYSIYVILLASVVLGICFFAFLLCAAGHRKDTDEIVASWLDKMPFDVCLGFAGLAEVFLGLMVREMSYHIERLAGIVAFAALIIAMCWVLLLSILTFAVRIKRGKWWKNTVIWWILHGIFAVCRTLVQNIGLIYKAILAIGVISLVEFFLIIREGSGGLATLWLLEKVVLVPLFLFAIIQMGKLKEGGKKLAEGDLQHQIDTEHMFWEFKQHGENLNSISEGMSRAVDERMKSERFKTELITNVSHDIKTPLTSIINYVDLLEKEELNNENAIEYLEVLDRQSGRLKKLIEDLIEASKASTGNLAVHLEQLEAGVSLVQTVGEFEEKLKAKELELLIKKPEEPIYIQADGRHYWRVIDNLMNNICKYAQPATRVYIDLEEQAGAAMLTFRNTSKYPLNITSEELMERFVRGDSSRNTEGSGLGLSIAKSLMELMGGTFDLYVDGDLFKVVLGFPAASEE